MRTYCCWTWLISWSVFFCSSLRWDINSRPWVTGVHRPSTLSWLSPLCWDIREFNCFRFLLSVWQIALFRFSHSYTINSLIHIQWHEKHTHYPHTHSNQPRHRCNTFLYDRDLTNSMFCQIISVTDSIVLFPYFYAMKWLTHIQWNDSYCIKCEGLMYISSW